MKLILQRTCRTYYSTCKTFSFPARAMEFLLKFIWKIKKTNHKSKLCELIPNYCIFMQKYGSFSLFLVTWISSLIVLVKKKPNMKQKGGYKYCKIKPSWKTYISRCCYLINIFSICEKDILPFSMTICERKMKCTASVYINIHTYTDLCF